MTYHNTSSDENLPPHLCLPSSMTEEGLCGGGGDTGPELSLCAREWKDSPKSISLMLDDEPEAHPFAVTVGGGIEVEIAPDLAARFDVYDDDGLENDEAEPAPRRRSLSQTTTFPSHLPFPSLESPPRETKNKRSTTPSASIEPKGSADRAQYLMESLQRLDDVGSSEQRRMNSAASVGIDSILTAMRQHKDNDRVQRYGCGALQKLACQSDTNRALIADAGGVLDILTAMERHPQRASIQERGCLALSSLSKATNGNACIAQCSGIETILAAMRAHVGHEAVQKHGCLVLLGLACSCANYNATIAKLGGIEDIMKAVSFHSVNAGIREYGSAALWSLAYMNSHNTAAIEKAGGIDAIFDVLNSSEDKEQLPSLSQEDQCMELINRQRNGSSEDQEMDRREGHGVDAILSVFVRPLQQ